MCILGKKLRTFIFETLFFIYLHTLLFLETEPDFKADYKNSWIEVFAPFWACLFSIKGRGNCIFFLSLYILIYFFFLKTNQTLKQNIKSVWVEAFARAYKVADNCCFSIKGRRKLYFISLLYFLSRNWTRRTCKQCALVVIINKTAGRVSFILCLSKLPGTEKSQ